MRASGGGPSAQKPNQAALKVAHELAAAARLVAFLRSTGGTIGDPRPGDHLRREPDAVCASPAGPVGIEVADAFYDGDVARQAWAPARGQPVEREGGAINFDEALARELDRTLRAHCGKAYSTPSYFLMDVSHAPLTTADDAPFFLDRLARPVGCGFVRVFLLMKENCTGAPALFEITRTAT